MWPWKKPKVVEEPKRVMPWWMGATFHEVISRKNFDPSKFIDEMIEFYDREGWELYGGMEPLAVLLLMERKQKDGQQPL